MPDPHPDVSLIQSAPARVSPEPAGVRMSRTSSLTPARISGRGRGPARARGVLAAAAAAAVVLLAAGPAAAHVEVEAEGARALGENVTIGFEAESESDSAGIAALRIVLPKGIRPADVTYGKGPKGWQFVEEADGYTVKGPALPVGESAAFSVTVRQLPDAKELAFKTLQTYGDGRVDRWIELGTGNGNPAPVLKLRAALPGAKSVRPISPGGRAPSAASSAPASASVAPAPAPAATGSASPGVRGTATESDEGLSAGAWAGIAAAVVAVVGAAVIFGRRRRREGGS